MTDVNAEAERIAQEQGVKAATQYLKEQESNHAEDEGIREEQQEDVGQAEEHDHEGRDHEAGSVEERTESDQGDAEEVTAEAPDLKTQVESMTDEQVLQLADRLESDGGEAPGWVIARIRKAARAEKEKASSAEQQLQSKVDSLEKLVSTMQQAVAQPEPQQQSSQNLNTEITKEQLAEALTYEPDKAADMVYGIIEQLKQGSQQTGDQIQYFQYKQALQSTEANAPEEYQTYKEMYKNSQAELLKQQAQAAGIAATDAQIRAEIDNRFENAAIQLLASGQDPANYLVTYMKGMGLEPNSTQKQAENSGVNLDNVAANIKKHQGLSSSESVSSSDADVDPSIEELGSWDAYKVKRFGERLAKKQKLPPAQWSKCINDYVKKKAGQS